MFINVFGEQIKSDLIKQIKPGNANGYCSTSFVAETGCSVILTTSKIHYRYTSRVSRVRAKTFSDNDLDYETVAEKYEVNDYIRFHDHDADEVSAEINKQVNQDDNK